MNEGLYMKHKSFHTKGRQTDRQTDRQADRQRQRQKVFHGLTDPRYLTPTHLQRSYKGEAQVISPQAINPTTLFMIHVTL